jgi:hypothetical protein
MRNFASSENNDSPFPSSFLSAYQIKARLLIGVMDMHSRELCRNEI